MHVLSKSRHGVLGYEYLMHKCGDAINYRVYCTLSQNILFYYRAKYEDGQCVLVAHATTKHISCLQCNFILSKYDFNTISQLYKLGGFKVCEDYLDSLLINKC